ncbi:isoleucine--tRNA ligase [Candidatus Daviesbacteria bacterium]|nr:isoleucine--tRNA ligase [Candidatus Daviesbacteria bacterium]
MKFKQVSSQIDFPAMERELLDYWYKQGIVEKYLHRNDKSEKKFSFLDGPITANNPMGVHHAWGRTYKDLWQRFWNMRGYKQRFQNGFDEQGLWVEVEVEKELGFKNKKDIEKFGIDKFVNLCKARVKKFAAVQTEQSKRLGYFMDWDNSYHTSSDENNYAIWNYLKVVHEKGWLYKGRDSVPWCPRCGTAISQHEILTEEYQEIIHDSVYFKLPIRGRKNEYLLVWTTTPWTIPANVAVAVDPKKDYLKIKEGKEYFYIQKRRAKVLGFSKGEQISGKNLVGLEYDAPFDHLPRVKKGLGEYTHRVVENDELILPISEDEGTGLVHVATGAGTEDFRLGLKLNLPVIEVIDEEANYLDGMESLSGQNAKLKPQLITGSFLFKTEKIKHRYPTCWRCKTELVWRVVDEWYIAMDRKPIYRQQMIEVAKKINWIPKWGLDRELDWLKNMHDWLISKKRYWGLSLPIWECRKCGNFEVIGSRKELKEKAVRGWNEFDGHSPHRPWIDQIKLKCSKCDEMIVRVPDVGNPWLDAGIVPFSTMPSEWFPADFITESFPGQFKNWFYSLIAMSTALKNENPFKNLLGFASLRDEKGEEMHKSKGNAIEFNEAADKIGSDVMRWMYLTQNPESNLHFGYSVASETKRRFYLILWNCYKFFVDYANLANFTSKESRPTLEVSNVLDKWILARLNEVIFLVNDKLEKYDASSASRAIEDFVVADLSTWYIRRSRGRDAALNVLYEVLVTLSKLLAPFTPFIAEEMYKNLTGDESVHLTDYPLGDQNLLDEDLVNDMQAVRAVAELAHATRKEAGIKLRQPLSSLKYTLAKKLDEKLEEILKNEVNVKEIKFEKSSTKESKVELNTKITQELKEEGEARELIRMIQQARKDQNLTLVDKTKITAPSWPKKFEKEILRSSASLSIQKGPEFKVLKAK